MTAHIICNSLCSLYYAIIKTARDEKLGDSISYDVKRQTNNTLPSPSAHPAGYVALLHVQTSADQVPSDASVLSRISSQPAHHPTVKESIH